MIYSLIRKLDMEYWATHCGNDGYLYLLFQRRFLKLSIYYSLISVILSFSSNFYYLYTKPETDSKNLTLHETVSKNVAIFFEKAAFENKEFSSYRAWLHVFMVAVFSGLAIQTIKKMRRDARVAY